MGLTACQKLDVFEKEDPRLYRILDMLIDYLYILFQYEQTTKTTKKNR